MAFDYKRTDFVQIFFLSIIYLENRVQAFKLIVYIHYKETYHILLYSLRIFIMIIMTLHLFNFVFVCDELQHLILIVNTCKSPRVLISFPSCCLRKTDSYEYISIKHGKLFRYKYVYICNCVFVYNRQTIIRNTWLRRIPI